MNKQEIKKAVKILGNFISDETHRRKYDKETVIELSKALITLKEIAENQLTNGWIPVSEKLPDINQNVLVTCRNADIAIDFIGEDGQWFWEDGEEGLATIAWQPLPEPWKEVSE